jgi:hypothetical protein
MLGSTKKILLLFVSVYELNQKNKASFVRDTARMFLILCQPYLGVIDYPSERQRSLK